MKTFFKQLQENNAPATTYHIGLLQTKAYKVIMGTTAKLLSSWDISNTEWVALGIVSEHPQGIRSIALSEIMDVEQPFITVTISNMIRLGYVEVSVDPTDKRAKIIFLSKAGKSFVKQVETKLSAEMGKLTAGISLRDALNYFKVLNSIVDYPNKK